jgi:hypothetical protein
LVQHVKIVLWEKFSFPILCVPLAMLVDTNTVSIKPVKNVPVVNSIRQEVQVAVIDCPTERVSLGLSGMEVSEIPSVK